MKNLPIALHTLAAIHDNNMVYIDKTEMAWHLLKQTGRFFLSRPRRFGKSLFVDTLKEIFEGNKELFKGLYIYNKWDWTLVYPVILIDFASGVLQSRSELDNRIRKILSRNQKRLGVDCAADNDIPGLLEDIILNSFKKYGSRVVVLVDEYDKPMLDNIDHPEVAAQMREGLKNLYSVLKGEDAHIQFVFMTGVSKFSKVSLFSGTNQLIDITLDEDFSTICGYTERDLETHFADHLKGVDRDKLRQWYNGYKWLGNTALYNPYDILLFIRNKFSYRNYWFETGNPSFLIKLFEKNKYFLPYLENIVVTEQILDSFDVEKIDPITLLFQSGYLTIEEFFTKRDRLMFKLEIPNQEVKIALNDVFIDEYTGKNPSDKIPVQDDLYTCMEQGDIEGMIGVIKRLFASIPYRNFTRNRLPDCEGYYASVLYAFFSSLDAQVIPEDITNHGQADMTVKLGNHIYVMEIKVIDMDEAGEAGKAGKAGKADEAGKAGEAGEADEMDHNPALEQIREKGYAQKYQGQAGISVHEVGLVFDRKIRNLVKWGW